MKIHINGTAYPLASKQSITLTNALTLHFAQPQKSTFAVALNGDFVGKGDYEHTIITAGDSIDVLQPIQGG